MRASLIERDTLLKEIHHRVKNNLQVIVSLLNLQSDQVTDAAALAAFHDTQSRVRAIARIHETLYSSADLAQVEFGHYARVLAGDVAAFYNASHDRIRLDVHTEEMVLDIDQAIPLGLILNELMTNSLKHAFPEERSGTVEVSLSYLRNSIGPDQPWTKARVCSAYVTPEWECRVASNLPKPNPWGCTWCGFSPASCMGSWSWNRAPVRASACHSRSSSIIREHHDKIETHFACRGRGDHPGRSGPLAAEAGYEVAGTAQSGAEAVLAAAVVQPDVVLMDVRLQGSMDGGAEATRQIRWASEVPIVFLTANVNALNLGGLPGRNNALVNRPNVDAPAR